MIEVTTKHNNLAHKNSNLHNESLSLITEIAANKDYIDKYERDYAHLKESYRILKE